MVSGGAPMSLVEVVLVLLAVGLAWWLFDHFLAPRVKTLVVTLIYIVVGISPCVWLLKVFGLWQRLATIQVPRI